LSFRTIFIEYDFPPSLLSEGILKESAFPLNVVNEAAYPSVALAVTLSSLSGSVIEGRLYVKDFPI
jgi:hypothetical protein